MLFTDYSCRHPLPRASILLRRPPSPYSTQPRWKICARHTWSSTRQGRPPGRTRSSLLLSRCLGPSWPRLHLWTRLRRRWPLRSPWCWWVHWKSELIHDYFANNILTIFKVHYIKSDTFWSPLHSYIKFSHVSFYFHLKKWLSVIRLSK